MKKWFIITLLSVVLIIPLSVLSQQVDGKKNAQLQDQQAILKNKVAELEKMIKELQDKVQKKEKQDKLKLLLEKAKNMSSKKTEKASITRKFHSGLRQQSALNPNISAGGDFYFAIGKSKTDYNTEVSKVSNGTGNFFIREMQIGIQSALDPFSRGKVFLSFGREGVEVEEAYVSWLNLPLNCNLKAGEFKAEFGKLNRYHDHALPQFDRPFVLKNFFGKGSLKGFGLSGNFLLPVKIADVNVLDLEVFKGGNDMSFTNGGKRNLVFVSHLKNYWDLSRSTYFELGLSSALGKNSPFEYYSSFVAGTDLTIKWVPPAQAKYKGVEWLTEVLYSRRRGAAGDINSWGVYSSVKDRLGPGWLISGRFDYSQFPWNNDLHETGFTVALDWWQSEFVFFRGQISYIDRNFDEGDVRFVLQTVWAMGPDKHEIY